MKRMWSVCESVSEGIIGAFLFREKWLWIPDTSIKLWLCSIWDPVKLAFFLLGPWEGWRDSGWDLEKLVFPFRTPRELRHQE